MSNCFEFMENNLRSRFNSCIYLNLIICSLHISSRKDFQKKGNKKLRKGKGFFTLAFTKTEDVNGREKRGRQLKFNGVYQIMQDNKKNLLVRIVIKEKKASDIMKIDR